MAEYIDKDIAIQICMNSWDTSDARQDIKDEPSADVVERSKLNKAREEIENISTYDGIYIDRAYVLEILDKLIESEG